MELYYADKLKSKKYHGNVVSVNGVCFPADLSTQHQKLKIFSSEHIDFMTELFFTQHILHTYLSNHNVIYTLMYGNLLGYYREKDQILWDDDIDILVDENGKHILTNLWQNSGTERKIWSEDWVCKEVLFQHNTILLCRMVTNPQWFKILLNDNFDKKQDMGGIDITFLNQENKDAWLDCSFLNDIENNDENYPVVQFGPVYARVVMKIPVIHEHLTSLYGKDWDSKNHPSLLPQI